MRSSFENIGLSKKFKFRFLNLKKITLFLFLLPSMVWSSILILPFENKSSRNYFWLSESISYALYSILQDEGIDVVSSEKRNSIYEELRISLTTPLTRATSIILANMAVERECSQSPIMFFCIISKTDTPKRSPFTAFNPRITIA